MRVLTTAAFAVAALVAPAVAFMPASPLAGPAAAPKGRLHATAMTIEVGSKLPLTTSFQVLRDGKPTDVAALDIFAGKKVVVVGVPGALTPTCSETHVPGYIAKAAEFKAKGVDEIVVLSVNDCFVMRAWEKTFDTDKVQFYADGGASFTKAAGLDFSTGDFGGLRMQRMSALVEDGVVKKLHLEGGGGLSTSGAETLLGEL